MIEFIEKEPYYDYSTFTGQCYMYPTFMVKDGKEYFMFNRLDPDDGWKLRKTRIGRSSCIEGRRLLQV